MRGFIPISETHGVLFGNHKSVQMTTISVLYPFLNRETQKRWLYFQLYYFPKLITDSIICFLNPATKRYKEFFPSKCHIHNLLMHWMWRWNDRVPLNMSWLCFSLPLLPGKFSGMTSVSVTCIVSGGGTTEFHWTWVGNFGCKPLALHSPTCANSLRRLRQL